MGSPSRAAIQGARLQGRSLTSWNCLSPSSRLSVCSFALCHTAAATTLATVCFFSTYYVPCGEEALAQFISCDPPSPQGSNSQGGERQLKAVRRLAQSHTVGAWGARTPSGVSDNPGFLPCHPASHESLDQAWVWGTRWAVSRGWGGSGGRLAPTEGLGEVLLLLLTCGHS